MCGIVGYIGDNAVQNVLGGLESLEYRGYDSAGIAVSRFGFTEVIKRSGRLKVLKDAVDIDGMLAIGHTRWATHGSPTEANAHPHTSGKITIVHNGIIENHHTLKLYGWLKDREFVSDTDSEVIAHIIDIMEGDNLFEKVSMALSHLEGSYALAVMSDDDPGTIVVARKHSPLVVGVFDGGAIIASDIQVVLPYINKVTVLADNEIGMVRENKLVLFQHGQRIMKDPLEISWTVAQSSRGDSSTFMEKEIHEQPVAIYDTMMNNNWDDIATRIYRIFDDNVITNVTLVACGTSLHACMVGAMMIEGVSGIRAHAKLASEISASAAIIDEHDLVIAVSQSGETADTLQAIRYARMKGATVVSIVNTRGSSVENTSNYTIHMAAGPEISVASTKAFSAQLVVLSMVTMILRACRVGSDNTMGQFVSTQNEIYRCADRMSHIFGQKPVIKRIAKDISSSKTVLYLGRGLNVPTALEGALKLKEISYIHAEGLAAGEMKHGSIALIENGTPVIAIVPKDQMYPKMLSSIEEARSRGAKIIAIATVGDREIKKIADDVIYIPDVGEIFTPMVATIPLQLLAMYAAEALGTDIDKPRNLAKSVTVE